MRRLRDRSVQGFLASTIIVGCLTATSVAGSDIASDVERAAELLRDGRLVRARDVLSSLDRNAMTVDERERTLELLAAADRRLRHADPVEVSLQKADLAIEQGDIRSAQRHALAARNARAATAEQIDEALRLLTESEELVRELEPAVGAALEQAITDFHDERYADAKAGLDAVYRSGCKLEPAQLRALDRYREMIVQIERDRGAPFELADAPLGLLQPGTVERRQDPRPERGGEQQAAPAAAQEQAQPAQPAQPSQAQPGDDVFERALRFDAQRYLAEADAAFTEGRFSEAAQKYELVTGAYRQHLPADAVTRAEQRLAEARTMLQDRTGDLLGQTVESRSLLRQQAVAEYDNLMQQAAAALSRGDFEQARADAGRARIAIVDRRDVFSEQELQDRLNRQEAMLQNIRSAEEAARRAEIEQRAGEVERETRDAATRQRADKERRILEALDRIRQLQLEQKYEEALQVVEQVLFLDPNNAAGLLLKDVLRDVVIYREWNDLQREKAYSYARESNRMQRSMVMPESLLSYPNDWPEISFRRGEDLAFVDTEEDRRVLSTLETKRVPATFAANTLEDVLTFIGAVTNLNMDVDWESLSEIGIERDDEITLNLRPVPVKVVLERILEKVSPDEFSRADWAVQDGVLVVASEEGLRRNTFVRIYDVRDLTFQVPNYTNVPELDLDSVLQQTGNRGGGGTQSIFNDANDADQALPESELLERLIDIVRTNVDFDGWAANGGETGRLEELNGNLIITNTAKNHRAIVGLLSQLREVRSIQINVEARFLTVSQDFFEQIGFDLDVYFNAKNNQYQEARDQQEFFGGNGSFLNPVPNNTSTLPSDLVGTRTNETTQWFIDDFDETTNQVTYQFGPQRYSVTAPDSLSIVPVQQNSFGLTEALLAAGGFAGEVLESNPAIGVAATFLDDIQVDLLLEATQADRRNVTLTAPRLTFLNGRVANIFVATQRSFVSDLTPIVGTASVAFDPTIAPLTEGVTLLIRGVVSADRRYVTLTVEADVAQFVEFRNVPVRAQAGGAGDTGGGQVVESNIEAPTVTISSINTGVTVPDQGTILLGGQSIVTESEIETGVPVLSKLPILNRLFTNRIEVKEEQTLLILLKPTILIQNEEEELNFPGLLDSLGVGFGAGL